MDRMCGSCPIPSDEEVAYPINAYDGPYKEQLKEDLRTGTCSFGRNFSGIWSKPPFKSTDNMWVGTHNTFITPEKYPGVIKHATLIIPVKHQSSVAAMNGHSFKKRAQILDLMRAKLGPATMWAERFGDELSGKTVTHAHTQVWHLVEGARRAFVVGTYMEQDPLPLGEVTSINSRPDCPICKGLRDGLLRVVENVGSYILVESTHPRLDLSGQPVAFDLAIVKRVHRPFSTYKLDFSQKGILFALAAKRYGITGGGMFQDLSGGQRSHDCLEIVIPRRLPQGYGAPVVFTAGSFVP